MKRSLAVLAAALALPALAHAQTGKWTFDAAHSHAYFTIRHMMVTDVHGEFSGLSGAVQYTMGKPESLAVEATIPVSTVDTRESKRDQHLKGPDFFDATRYPEMKFVSKSAKKVGGKIELAGDLTLRGVTKPVTLVVEGLDRLQKNPWGQTVLAGVAKTTIDRKDFGLTWNKTLETGGMLVGDQVAVELAIELNPVAPAGSVN